MAYIPPNSNGQATMANSEPVVIASDQTAVPVSAASLPLPTGAATSASQTTGNTSLGNIDTSTAAVNTVLGAKTDAKNTATDTTSVSAIGVLKQISASVQAPPTQAVTGTFWQATQPVSGTFWQATQPVSGTVTANAGTNLNTSALALDATLTGGTQVAIAKGAAASGAAKSGNPVQTGGVFNTTQPTVTTGQAVESQATARGATIVAPGVDNFAVQATLQASSGVDIGKLTANQSVNTSQINGVTPLMGNGVTGTGSQRVTIASDNTAFSVNATLAAETTKVIGTVNQGTSPWVTSNATTSVVGNGAAATAQRVTLANDSTGIIGTVAAVTAITNALPAGTNLMGKVGIDQTTPGTTNAVVDTPVTSGGLTKFHLVSAATDNATNVKASAGQVYAITGFNVAATPRYLKFHNTAGTPTAGSGVTDTYLIPGNTSGAGFVINIDKGIPFATGIAISIVTGIADNNTAAISASEVVVNIYYK